MAKSNRNKKFNIPTRFMLLLLTGVCVLAILISFTLNISGGPLNTVAGYLFIPMQTGINVSGDWISTKANDFRTLKDVLKENEELHKQIDDLTTELNRNKLEQYELDNYRQLLELDEKYPSYEKVAASVIAKDSSNWFSTFTINKGKKDGIKTGMNVISGSGLVGIVVDVGSNYAKVRSIINDTSNVSGMVSSTGDNFTISGSLEKMNTDKAIIFNQLRDRNDKVKVGDPVVTSYVSDMYQQGILIGYIASIENNSNNLTKSGTITPIVDFEHLENVLVILQIKDTGVTDFENSAMSDDDDEAVEESTEISTEESTEDSSESE